MNNNRHELEKYEESLKYKSPSGLTNEELIAIIIRHGDKTKTASEVAENVLKRYGNHPRDLKGVSASELASDNPGLSSVKAMQIVCALELGRRAYTEKPPMTCIFSAEDIASILEYDMSGLNKEHFKAVLLNSKNMLIGVEDVSVGTVNASLVHVREVFMGAIKKNASSIILVHNHPSGDTAPSKEDINITKKLEKAGRLLGIEVKDHVILGFGGDYLSLKEKSLF